MLLCAGRAEQRAGAGLPGVVHVPGGALCAGLRGAAGYERRAGRVRRVALARLAPRQCCRAPPGGVGGGGRGGGRGWGGAGGGGVSFIAFGGPRTTKAKSGPQ